MTIALKKLNEAASARNAARSDAAIEYAEKFRGAAADYDVADSEAFATFVRDAEECGVSRSELANEFNVSPSTVWRWATGVATPAKYARGVIVQRISDIVMSHARPT